MAWFPRRSGERRDGPRGRGSSMAGCTDEVGAVVDSAPLGVVDESVRLRAGQIARQLALTWPAHRRRARRTSGGKPATMRWQGSTDEIDLDATFQAVAGNPVPTSDDVMVRERVRDRRSIVLVVDMSGSARGEKIRTAAATVGAVVGELGRDDLAVVAFWSDAALVAELGERLAPATVVDRLLSLPVAGLTNLTFALDVARRQLAGRSPVDARVVLLSDCVHNAGPDPRGVAALLPRLDVLIDLSGENDLELGRDLSAIGGGRCRVVRDHHGVAGALMEIFS
ncbi:vWA domain-containing protein [Nocardia africana]